MIAAHSAESYPAKQYMIYTQNNPQCHHISSHIDFYTTYCALVNKHFTRIIGRGTLARRELIFTHLGPIMERGRPRGWELDPKNRNPAAQQIVEFDERDRIRLPAQFLECIPWLQGIEGSRDALLILNGLNEGAIVDWVENSQAILETRVALLENFNEVETAADDLRLLEDRYFRVKVSKDLRVTFPDEAIFHFGLHTESRRILYTFADSHGIRFLAKIRRVELGKEFQKVFPDLP